jgi:hypothetical protein
MSITAKLKSAYALFRLILNVVPQLIRVHRNKDELEALGEDMSDCPDCKRHPLKPCDKHKKQMNEFI